MRFTGRFIGQNIKPDRPDAALLQTLQKRRLINQAAAGGVYDHRMAGQQIKRISAQNRRV